jgi:hypothetical protein
VSFLDRFKPAIEKAKEKAQDPEFQQRVKEQAQKQMQRRRQGQHRAFEGGGPDAPGYPWPVGHAMHGQYAYPGFYDDDGQWFEQDSDGDGVPDSQDAAPNDPNVQSQSDVDPGGFDDSDPGPGYDSGGDVGALSDDGGFDGGDGGE